jgi:hypothetical protein
MADVDALLERLPSGIALLKILKELNAADGQAIKVLVGKLLSEALGKHSDWPMPCDVPGLAWGCPKRW